MSRGLGFVERRALYWLQRSRRELHGFVSPYAMQISLSTPDLAYLIFVANADFRRSFFRTRRLPVPMSQLTSVNRALNRLHTKKLVSKQEEKAAFGTRLWTAVADAPTITLATNIVTLDWVR
jgi:hypothetical protein